jgi:formylglycine-generating enzyme required for sulfatase activity
VGDAIPLQMLLIPQGSFVMGSPDDEPERGEREGPQHEVAVPAFFMGRYPVTQAQYERLMGTNPATAYDSNRFVAPNKPIIGVSWEDAVAFCDRLAELTGRQYRLPSEAEWEYACRAGTTTPFYFGQTLTTEVANYNGNYAYANGPTGENRNALTPVNHFGIANAFGLSDMHGNVFEWCQDQWQENYEGASSNASDRYSLAIQAPHVLRGGSWKRHARYSRSAYRSYPATTGRNDHIGFRICCTAPRALQ